MRDKLNLKRTSIAIKLLPSGQAGIWPALSAAFCFPSRHAPECHSSAPTICSGIPAASFMSYWSVGAMSTVIGMPDASVSSLRLTRRSLGHDTFWTPVLVDALRSRYSNKPSRQKLANTPASAHSRRRRHAAEQEQMTVHSLACAMRSTSNIFSLVGRLDTREQ